MPGLENYDLNTNGFGSEGQQLLDLQKAMVAGEITGMQTVNLPLTQQPLKAESLEKILKILEFRNSDIKLWNSIPKLSAFNTVEEFLQLSSYGNSTGGFYQEGELSDVVDSSYVRRASLVKYIQVTGEVTMQAQMVRSYIDAMRQEVENKTQWVVRRIDQALTKADSNIIPEEFDSLYAQHASIGTGQGFLYSDFENYYNSGTVIDLRGKSLTQNDVQDAAIQVDLNYGNVNSLFGPTTVISGLAQDYYQSQRILMNADSGYAGMIGTVPKAIATTIGDVALIGDKFMASDKPRMTVDPATTAKAPAAPTGVAVNLRADNLVKYKGTELGNVYYGVTSLNRYGESPLEIFATPVTLAAGQRPDITFTPPSSMNPVSGYTIYRTEVTTSTDPTQLTFYPIFRISVDQFNVGVNGGAAKNIGDRGYYLPNTESAFLTDMSEEVMSFKQLAPISKLDLAVLSMSRRFIIFLFGTPQLYAPKKMVKFINAAKNYKK